MAAREEALVELRAIYAAADAAAAARPELRCELSGRCCRFRESDHRLYLTALEMEEMAARGGEPEGGGGDACPWLRRGLCANREGRALACRTYYCSDEEVAAAITEQFHEKIRRLHERWGLPYAYRDLGEHLNLRARITSEEA